jgi:hypothetical protein
MRSSSIIQGLTASGKLSLAAPHTIVCRYALQPTTLAYPLRSIHVTHIPEALFHTKVFCTAHQIHHYPPSAEASIPQHLRLVT